MQNSASIFSKYSFKSCQTKFIRHIAIPFLPIHMNFNKRLGIRNRTLKFKIDFRKRCKRCDSTKCNLFVKKILS